MNNFFKRSKGINNFNDIYTNLKLLNEKEISIVIKTNYNKIGIDFLNSMILNSILDIDKASNKRISFIEKFSQNLIKNSRRKNELSKIIKSWQIWFVAIGSFGCFIIELIKFVLQYYFKIK